jgi:hypothetical protein
MLPQVMVKPSDYPFWKGVMKVKDFFKKKEDPLYLEMVSKQSLGKTLGWATHIWHISTPQFNNLVCLKNVLVHDVFIVPLNIEFRRAPTKNNWVNWLHLVHMLMIINLTTGIDSFV